MFCLTAICFGNSSVRHTEAPQLASHRAAERRPILSGFLKFYRQKVKLKSFSSSDWLDIFVCPLYLTYKRKRCIWPTT